MKLDLHRSILGAVSAANHYTLKQMCSKCRSVMLVVLVIIKSRSTSKWNWMQSVYCKPNTDSWGHETRALGHDSGELESESSSEFKAVRSPQQWSSTNAVQVLLFPPSDGSPYSLLWTSQFCFPTVQFLHNLTGYSKERNHREAVEGVVSIPEPVRSA